MDLGASPWRTFRKVTLPLITPGILAAALLSFALSIDDYIITFFNAGSEETFPLQDLRRLRSRALAADQRAGHDRPRREREPHARRRAVPPAPTTTEA